MFWVVRHIGANWRVPKFNKGKDYSLFYSFCEGKEDGWPFRFDEVTEFDKAFKYKEKELAEKFIKNTYDSLKTKDKTGLFEIEEYTDWPIEYLKLTNKSKILSIKLEHCAENWQDMSRYYCNICGILIPPNLKFLHIPDKHIFICPFCMGEVNDITNQHLEVFQQKNKVLADVIEQERFVSRI